MLAVLLAAELGGAQRAHGQKSPTAEKATARAQQALAAGRYADAIQDLQTAVRYEPRFALGWYLLASSQRKAGDCDRAISAYRRYLELRPGEAEPHYGIGLCLDNVGDRAGALASFRRYIELEKKAGTGSGAQPGAQSFVEDAQKRAEVLDRDLAAAAQKSEHPAPEPPVLIEARRLRTAGHAADAIQVYRTWLASNPKDTSPMAARVHAELGAALIVTRDLPAAVEALHTAVRLDPTHAPSWYNLGFALRLSGQAKESVDAYSRYITFAPKDPDPFYGLGMALSALGRTDEAVAALRTYVALESRPSEQRWVTKVRAEIARLSGAPVPLPPAAAPPAPAGSTAPRVEDQGHVQMAPAGTAGSSGAPPVALDPHPKP